MPCYKEENWGQERKKTEKKIIIQNIQLFK